MLQTTPVKTSPRYVTKLLTNTNSGNLKWLFNEKFHELFCLSYWPLKWLLLKTRDKEKLLRTAYNGFQNTYVFAGTWICPICQQIKDRARRKSRKLDVPQAVRKKDGEFSADNSPMTRKKLRGWVSLVMATPGKFLASTADAYMIAWALSVDEKSRFLLLEISHFMTLTIHM